MNNIIKALLSVDTKKAKEIQKALNIVEEKLKVVVEHDDKFVNETSQYLVNAGGKRLRPLLVFISSYFGNFREEDLINVAIVMELTHLGTLYHDDVMDEAIRRRGVLAANVRFGNNIAILSGDLLFARASLVLADLGIEAVRLHSKIFERLVVGQLRETIGAKDDEDQYEYYVNVVREKTASLISASCMFGAMFSKCDSDILKNVAMYGEYLGIAFQISDDIIDVMSDSKTLGKMQGQDLVEGVLTLPAILAKKHSTDERLLELLSKNVRPEDIQEIALRMSDDGIIEQSKKEMNDWLSKAVDCLKYLPDGFAKDALKDICMQIPKRNR